LHFVARSREFITSEPEEHAKHAQQRSQVFGSMTSGDITMRSSTPAAERQIHSYQFLPVHQGKQRQSIPIIRVGYIRAGKFAAHGDGGTYFRSELDLCSESLMLHIVRS
jgi:hypothetical protein